MLRACQWAGGSGCSAVLHCFWTAKRDGLAGWRQRQRPARLMQIDDEKRRAKLRPQLFVGQIGGGLWFLGSLMCRCAGSCLGPMADARTIRGLAPVAVTNREVGCCRTVLVLDPKERNHTSVAGMSRVVLAIDLTPTSVGVGAA